jgi:hypothetical protein
MTRAFNVLAFMRHYNLGLRESMVLVVVNIHGVATVRNVMENMGMNYANSLSMISMLCKKEVLEKAPIIRTSGTKHANSRPAKCWRVKNQISKELDILEETNRLPKWPKSQATPASGKRS